MHSCKQSCIVVIYISKTKSNDDWKCQQSPSPPTSCSNSSVKPTMSDTQCGEKALAKYDGSYHKLFSAVSDCIFDLQRSWWAGDQYSRWPQWFLDVRESRSTCNGLCQRGGVSGQVTFGLTHNYMCIKFNLKNFFFNKHHYPVRYFSCKILYWMHNNFFSGYGLILWICLCLRLVGIDF